MAVVLLALLAFVVLAISACQDTPEPDLKDSTPASGKADGEEIAQPGLTDSVLIVQVATKPTDVLTLLLLEHEVEYASSRMGAFVEAIDSVAGDNGWFWMFAVNGQTAQKAADKYQVEPGDTVRWVFRKAQ